MEGKIVSYTKNGIGRMDTIQKYFDGQKIKVYFSEDKDDHFSPNCGVVYEINGVLYSTDPSSSNCLNNYLLCNYKGDEILIPWYNIADSTFISLVDGVSPCNPVYWKFKRRDKSGDFDLQYTTPEGDVYKLEFR